MGKLISRTPAGDNLRRLGAAENMLKVLPTEIPSLSVRVTEGSYILNGKTIFEVETTQIQPLTLPTVGNMWAAILATGSTITVAYGSPSSTGAAMFPNIPTGALLLAGVYLSANTQYITESLIKDLRPIYGISSVIDNHEELSNRDVPDAHPISSITGLQEALDSKITAEYLNTKLDKCAAVDGTSSNTFTLQNDLIGSATDNAAILVNRGNLPAAQIRWNEMESMWEISDGSKFVGIATKEDTDTIAGIDPSTIAIKADVNADIARLETEIATKADENRLDEVIIALADKADRQEMNDAIQNLPNRQMMLEAINAAARAAEAVDSKADADSVYTKEEADERFVPKEGSDTFATDEEVDEKLSNYMLTEDIEEKFTEVETTLDTKADKLDVDTALDEKADKADTYTKNEVDTLLDEKITVGDVYTKEEVDQKIEENESYSKVEIDQKLTEKADIDDVYQYLDNTIALFPSIYQTKLGYTPEDIANKDVPGGYPSLDSNGKLSIDVLPDLNGQQTYVVNTIAEMEALEDLQAGDKAFILEDNENSGDSYIYDGTQWVKFADADWANVNLSFQNIVDKPSTISGYGITDAYTQAEVDALLATKAALLHTHEASDISTTDDAQFTTKARNEKVDALPNAEDIPTNESIDEKIAEAVEGIDFVDDNELQTALADYAKAEDVNTAIEEAVAGIDFVDEDELQAAIADFAKSEDVTTEINTAVENAVAGIDFIDDNELQAALADYAKSEDVSAEIDEKVADAVEGIDFVDENELQTALGDYTTTEDLNALLEDKADKADLTDLVTKEYVDTADEAKVDKTDIFKNGVFNVKQVDEDTSYNLFFQEKNSGGGNQYFNAPTNTLSYLGVNKPATAGSDVDIQLYSKDKTSNIGTRINISSSKGMFYLKGTQNLGFPDGREVAVKDDLADFATTADLEAKVDKTAIFTNDAFNVKQVDEDTSYNLFFQEKNSGGGNQYYNALTNTLSYLGVNKPSTAGSDVDIQLYSKDKTSNIGTRINISSTKGLFYLKNGLNLGFPEGREVLVKDDLVDYVTSAYCEETYQKKNENLILVDSNGVKYEIGIDTAGNITATVKN